MALDLTNDVPRSPFAELGGLPWLARMIDKARAHFAGTIGDYTPYPCPADQKFLAYTGLDADQLGEVIKSGADDQAVIDWVKANMKALDAEAIAAYRKGMFAPIADAQMLEYFNGAKQGLKAAQPDADLSTIDNWSKLICVEEGHPIPQA